MRSRKPDEAADEERMKFRELYCDAAIEHAPGDPESLAILFVLARKYADWNTGERCWPSDEELARYARCSERTVRRRRDLLENLGWFETWKEHGKGICYRLIIPEPNATPTGHRVQSHRTQSPVTPDTESTNSSAHRTQSPDPLDSVSGGHRTQSPANKNQENKNQETKEEEGVVQGSIADVNNIDGDPPPPPDLILEHQGTPLAAREGILPAEDENKDPHHNPEESANAKLQEWVENKLKSFGLSIGDSKGVTELRVKLLISQLTQSCPEADHRTACEWLKRRLANFAARTFEDRGPNPPNSIHQALEWLETDLGEGSLAKFHEAKRIEQGGEEFYNEIPHASECNHDQDLILEPRFTSGGKEASK